MPIVFSGTILYYFLLISCYILIVAAINVCILFQQPRPSTVGLLWYLNSPFLTFSIWGYSVRGGGKFHKRKHVFIQEWLTLKQVDSIIVWCQGS